MCMVYFLSIMFVLESLPEHSEILELVKTKTRRKSGIVITSNIDRMKYSTKYQLSSGEGNYCPASSAPPSFSGYPQSASVQNLLCICHVRVCVAYFLNHIRLTKLLLGPKTLLGGPRGKSRGLMLYFTVYPDLSHNTDILIYLTMDLLLQ